MYSSQILSFFKFDIQIRYIKYDKQNYYFINRANKEKGLKVKNNSSGGMFGFPPPPNLKFEEFP
jgi:hypothetical protein